MSIITAMVFCLGASTWEEPQRCLWVEREERPFKTEHDCRLHQMRMLANPVFVQQILTGLNHLGEFEGEYNIDAFCVPEDEWDTFQIEHKVPSLDPGTDT